MRKITAVLMVLILSVVIMGSDSCDDSYEGQGDTHLKEAQLTENNQSRLIEANPPPMLTRSLERANLRERLLRFNDASKVSYIYLISNTGVIMTFMPIKGKVSSVNSKLTTGEQIVDDTYGGSTAVGGKVVESPQLDGSYGTNGDAIFFFTTEGVYVEWSGIYMLCDQPLKLSTPPLMVYQMDSGEL